MAAVLTVQIGFVYFGGSALRTVPLTPSELLRAVLPALLVFPADMVRKLLWRLFGGGKGGRY